uniref:M23 family metallopeptidase n=2 Tax=Yoonia sp. TaxID=2212373 RepID=UPI0040476323|tara:strand:+ start:158143 stop:159102 length:960 start_codon:yes stop_codon:yes gene_type:complete
MFWRGIAFISLAATPAAGEITLDFPLDCTLGDDCFIQQFVDNDPGAGVSDFLCGNLTYDGHKGTDIALLSLVDQAAGVTVLAAASGTVTGTRNDMADILQIGPTAPDVAGRECGNGVVIRHEGGFETQYCHMARGSITVTPGQSVTAGTALGQVGLSGQTQFPHLEMSLRKDGQTIDPFNTDGQAACPDPTTPSLWAVPLATPAGGIVNIGLADAVPAFDDIKAGTANTGATSDSPAMVAWVHLFGPRDGDTLQMTMTGPNGVAFETTQTLDRDQARAFRAFGKRTPTGGWTKGAYILNVSHLRGDVVLDTASQTFSVD